MIRAIELIERNAALRVLHGALYGGRCVNPVNLLAQAEQMR